MPRKIPKKSSKTKYNGLLIEGRKLEKLKGKIKQIVHQIRPWNLNLQNLPGKPNHFLEKGSEEFPICRIEKKDRCLKFLRKGKKKKGASPVAPSGRASVCAPAPTRPKISSRFHATCTVFVCFIPFLRAHSRPRLGQSRRPSGRTAPRAPPLALSRRRG